MAFTGCILPNAVKCSKINYLDTSDFNLVFSVLGLENTLPQSRGKMKSESQVQQICTAINSAPNGGSAFLDKNVFPFTVGGCSTNELNEYLYLRELVAVESVWAELCQCPTVEGGAAFIVVAEKVVDAPYNVPAGCTGVFTIQKNLPHYLKAARQLVKVLSYQKPELEPGDLHKGPFCFIDTKSAVVVAADAAASECGMKLHAGFDSAVLSTALGWVAMLDKKHTLSPKVASAITISRNAAMRTGTVIEEDKTVADTVNSWFDNTAGWMME